MKARAESANPTLRSGTGNNKLHFNAKDPTQMKRIEAVMKENGKAVTPAASPMLKSSNKTTASTNFVESTQPVNLSNQKNII